MVAIYKQDFGRGPTKVRTDWAGDDVLVCTLANALTAPERKMSEAGDAQRVRELRLYFQHASEDSFVDAVEEITGRKVSGFVSGTDVERDLSTEVFYLDSAKGP
jgi:uncharacterized protein YbcI